MFEVGPIQRWTIARVELVGASRRILVTLEYLVEAALDMVVKLSAEVGTWNGRLIDNLYTLGQWAEFEQGYKFGRKMVERAKLVKLDT